MVLRRARLIKKKTPYKPSITERACSRTQPADPVCPLRSTYLRVRTIIVDRGPVLGLLITYPSSVSRVFSRSLGARSIGQDILSTRLFSLNLFPFFLSLFLDGLGCPTSVGVQLHCSSCIIHYDPTWSRFIFTPVPAIIR